MLLPAGRAGQGQILRIASASCLLWWVQPAHRPAVPRTAALPNRRRCEGVPTGAGVVLATALRRKRSVPSARQALLRCSPETADSDPTQRQGPHLTNEMCLQVKVVRPTRPRSISVVG